MIVFTRFTITKGKEVVKRRFDIVIGSGINGQTYLSWIDKHLIELPVSLFHSGASMGQQPGLSSIAHYI
jgi:hypothetical protein